MLQDAAGQDDIEGFILEWKRNGIIPVNNVKIVFAEK